MNKKILITGSEGFLGTYLKNEFLKNKYKVIGLDNLSTYKKKSIKIYNKNNYSFFNVDCRNQNKTLSHLKDCDYIIINAAKVGGIKLLNNGFLKLFNENHKIFSNTLEASINAFLKFKLKKIILISTSMIYENNGKNYSKESDVSKIAYPKNLYAFQKFCSENFLINASKKYGFKYNIIRPFNLVGPFDKSKLKIQSHVVPELIKKLKNKNKEIKIYGNGLQERSFTSVSEVAKSIYLICDKKKCDNEIFNVGSETSSSILTLIKIISHYLKIKKKINISEAFGSDVNFNRCNSDKLFKYTKFKPSKSLESIIKKIL
jgi:nucleoside-diphosphate-sugar epimerase